VTPIYHITHIQNLSTIINDGGLHCDKVIAANKLNVRGIAHKHIKERRDRRKVPVCVGGTLSDYVPFYFAPRSPMLFAIHKGNVEGYTGGQGEVLHLVSNAEAVAKASGLPFCFTEGHAEMGFSDFFESLNDLEKVDWKIMGEQYWSDTVDDMDRKRRRQAEFLVHQFFPWDMVTHIGVISSQMADVTKKAIAACQHQPAIIVARQWYY